MFKNDKSIPYNLILMIINWSCVSFFFYLLNFFIKYMPGDIFINSIISGLACFTMLLQGPLQKRFSSKFGLIVSFGMGLGSVLLICLFDNDT